MAPKTGWSGGISSLGAGAVCSRPRMMAFSVQSKPVTARNNSPGPIHSLIMAIPRSIIDPHQVEQPGAANDFEPQRHAERPGPRGVAGKLADEAGLPQAIAAD